MEKIIFACVHNAGRSQMAAAFFNAFADHRKAIAVSGGTEPAPGVHPAVVVAMSEAGIDLGTAAPRLLAPEITDGAAWLITMGCGGQCPVVPGARRADWAVDDPKGQPIERVREIRDEISRRVRTFVTERGLD